MSTVEERRRVRRALRRAGRGVTGNGGGGGGDGRRRRRLVVVGGLGLVVAAIAGVVVGVLTGSKGKGSSAAGIKGGSVATVARRDLVETDSESGTLGYGDARTVVNRLNGTITWLPREGAVVRRGGTLYKVDANPVILMYGGQPAYRTMRSGREGHDVLQLERNLQSLGYDPGAADGTYTDTTASAVRSWQADHALPETGRVGLGRVVFLPSARRIGTISATLGGSAAQGAGGGGNGDSANGANAAYYGPSTPRMENAAYVAASDPAQTTPTDTTPPDITPTDTTPQQTTPTQPQPQTTTPSESSDSASPRSSSDSPNSNSPSGAQAAANAVMETTSTKRLVSVDLDTTKQTLARRGERVEIEMPSGDLVRGRISSVSKVAKEDTSNDQSGQDNGNTTSTLTVDIRLIGHPRVGDLDETPVTVRFAQDTRRDVLSVPVTALLATAGSHFAVVALENGRRRTIEVQPGLSAGGYVEVSGPGVHEGMRVVDSASE